MVFRRRTVRRRATVKRRPAIRRRVARPARGLRNYRNYNVHKYKRSLTLVNGAETSATGGFLGLAYTFTLNSLPAASEFTTLYDQYRITGVALSVMWRSTNISIIETDNSGSAPGAPYMYWVIDRDDVTAPVSINTIKEFSRAKLFAFNGTSKRQFRTYIKPNTLGITHTTGSSTGYCTQFNQWVDCDYSTTEYFGIKLAIQTPVSLPTGNPQNFFDVEATLYLQFKDPR